MDNHELYHHGIKGMKWGVRRFQKKNGSLTPAGKKRQKEKWSEDATEASKIRKKSVKEMSNAELKRLNERTRLEQEYSRLNPSNRKKAIAAVTATAATMGTLLNLYNNSDKLIEKGRPIAQKLINPIAKKAKDAMAIGLWSDIHSDELYHYGVKGMKWGVRRYQNKDGSLTKAGKQRQTSSKLTKYESLSEQERLTRAQDLGTKAMSSYKKLSEEYDPKIKKAMNSGDYAKAFEIDDELEKRFNEEVVKPMIKSGYDYVHRGGGRDTYFIQFGKHLSEVEYDKYGSERYVDDFMIENGDMKVYRTDE